jgi:uncharacterized protein YndB with AHSA1/START domain
MSIEFEVSGIVAATPKDVYQAWLDSNKHGMMTGSFAQVSDQVGGQFEAWDGYIQGVNLELSPNTRILQSWRTTEFEDSDEDSRLEITFEAHDKGTQITILHSNLPAHGMQYQQGWVDAYFTPMQEYFGE